MRVCKLFCTDTQIENVQYATEYFRRYYGSLVKSAAMALSGPSASEIGAQALQSNLEIPLIIASAATSAFICCFFIAPFDAVRIRTVSQPDYAPNFFAVSSRMIKEEGLASLFVSIFDYACLQALLH